MRIRIDFADMPDATCLSYYKRESEAENLRAYMQEEYFHDAENAIKFIRMDFDSQFYEFELMPG